MKEEMKKKLVIKNEIVVVDKGRDEDVHGLDCCWGSLFAI